MATEIELNTKINTANSAQSIGQLNKSLKDLISLQSQVGAGSSEYGKLAKAINDTEGRIGDLQDGLVTLRGSGVERLNASFGLLREGLTSGDIGKAKVAFDGLKGAMSAIPIFLLIEGVKALYENFDKIVPAFKEFFNIASDTEREIKQLTLQIEKQKEANEVLFVVLENQIKILEAQGNSEEKILAIKKQLTEAKIKEAETDVIRQKAIIREIILNDDLSESIYRSAAAVLRKMGKDLEADAIEKKLQQEKNERIAEASKVLKDDLINIENLKTNQKVEEIKVEKDHQKDLLKIKEDRFKAEDEARKQRFAKQQAELKQQLSDEEYLQELDKLQAKQKAEEDDQLAKFNADKLSVSAQLAEEKYAKEKADRDKDRAEFIADQNARLQIASASVQSLQGLSDLAFTIRQTNLKKGSEQEEASARRQFQVNKALQIANAGISGAQGILMAATQPSGVPTPFDIPFRVAKAVGIGLTTAATIAKISATQFNSGSSGGGASSGSINTGGGGGNLGGGASLPSNQTLRPLDFNQGTVNKIGTANNSQPVKVYVTDYDINKVRENTLKVQANAKFP